ncbi:MAG: glutathione S-transferase family protein [Pseudomonadales bacterium]|nr:glutathione S-transferase family protein [Pseudomonadales bacterium]
MTQDIILYDYDGSPCSRRVKITLIEKGITFKIQSIDLSKMQQKHPDYLNINPNGLVPALAIDGRVLFESSVINDYLEDRYPDISLSAPTTEGKIATQMWQTCELAMAKLYRPLMYSRISGPFHHIACSKDEFLRIAAKATDNPAHLAWEEKIWNLEVLTPTEQESYTREIYQFADRVERALENKRYLVDDQFTFADIAVYPRMNMFSMAGINLNEENYPNVKRWMNELQNRRSFRESKSDLDNSMAKLRQFGIIDQVNRILYQDKAPSLKDRIVLKALRPVFRKAFKIEDALKPSFTNHPIIAPAQSHETTIAPKNEIPSSRKQASKPLSGGDKFTLYGDIHSPICQRIEWVLASMGIKYQFKNIDLAKKQHKELSFSALNPAQELPLIVHNGQCIYDSLFIAEYLDSLNPDLNLFSNNFQELCSIRLWNAFDMGMHKEFGLLFYHRLGLKKASKDEFDNAINVLNEKLSYLETHLSEHKYLVANRLSYADYVMFSRLKGIRFVCGLERFHSIDNIKLWEKRINKEINKAMNSQSDNSQKSKVEAIS